jgi:hypothetical protein
MHMRRSELIVSPVTDQVDGITIVWKDPDRSPTIASAHPKAGGLPGSPCTHSAIQDLQI